MPSVTFSPFDISLSDVCRKFEAVAQSDIREAHGETVSRPSAADIHVYLYEAAISAQDRDQKDYEEEVAAQMRLLDGRAEP